MRKLINAIAFQAAWFAAVLGAMTRLPEPEGLLWIGIAWAVALPLLYGTATMLTERFHSLHEN